MSEYCPTCRGRPSQGAFCSNSFHRSSQCIANDDPHPPRILCDGDCVHTAAADRLIAQLQSEIESAQAACDGPVSRAGTDGPRPLAERVSCLRKMLTEAWREQVEPPLSEEEERDLDDFPLQPGRGVVIAAFAAGFLLGALVFGLIVFAS